MTFGSRGLTITLLVSLMLNAFLLGSILTHFARDHRRTPERHHLQVRPRRAHGPSEAGGERWTRRGPAEAQLLRDVVQVLGGPRDARVRAALSSSRQKMLSHHERMERAQGAIRSALSAQPYDEARLLTTLSELRSTSEIGQKEAQETLVRLAAQLTEEERARLRSGVLPAHPEPWKP